MKRGLPTSESDYEKGLTFKMRTTIRNTFSSETLIARPVFFAMALLAALAAGFMLLMPGGLVFAQADGTIMYPENGTEPVATFTAVDPEGESIVWSLATGGDMEDFDIDDGVLTFKSSPDYEMPAASDDSNTYVVTVQASDGGDGTTTMEPVTIEVTNVEEPGTLTLSTLQPQVGMPITATLTDPDNIGADNLTGMITDDVTWQWYRGSTEIVGATTSSYTPTTGDVGSVLRATAMYDDGEDDDKTAQEDSAYAVRAAPASNVPPTFPTPSGQEDTNQTREVAENTPAGANLGDTVTATDTDVLTYSLGGVDAASFSIDRATGQLTTKAALDYEDTNNPNHEFEVMVTATDPFGTPATAEVTIMVTDVNEAPSVDGAASIDHVEDGTVLDIDSSDQSANAAEYVASDVDADDNAADLTWSLSGADANKFSITEAGAERTLAFKANPDYESPGDSGANNLYEVTLVVTDSKGNTDEQAVTVKVTNMEEAGLVTLSTLQPRVGFPVTATLTDPDNVTADSVSWQWYRGRNVSTTNLPETDCVDANADNCPIKDATSATYTPGAGDAAKILTAVATYTDGNANALDVKDVASGEADNTVVLNTINKAPVFEDQDLETEGRQTAQERTVEENTASGIEIGGAVTATDEDMNLTYALGGPDAASFDINRGEDLDTAGQLKTKAALDKETKDVYTVTVTATDSLGLSSTITVTIKVTNVDEMPDLEGEAPEKYAENGTGAVATFTATDPEGESIVWSLTGADMGDFSIENGVLRFKSSPDYEDTGNTDHMYTVTVQASDGGATPAMKEVTIEITNVDEPGTVTLSTLQPQVGQEITATLDDPDNEEANTVTWQWYRGSNPITTATEGGGTVMSDYTPAAGDVGSTLRAQAMYDDGEGDDKTARGVSYRSVRSEPAKNTPPAFPDQIPGTSDVDKDQERDVAENTPAGRNLGGPVAANDPGDVLTYSLGGADAASFDINRVTGQLTTKAALDHEMRETYSVTVTATDPFGSPDSSIVTITVTDVNEAPVLSGGAASIDHAENATDLDDAGTTDQFAATDADEADPDGDLKWTLSGADASKFNISDTPPRTLSFKAAPDFETPGDSGGNNVYEVTVKVTDSEGNSDEQDVTVKVTNVEEPGTVTLSTLQPRVGFPVTATLTDPDNIAAGSVSWQWYKGTVTQDLLVTLDMTECVAATPNNCFIKGAASDTYTPVAFDVTDTLVAVALYTDGRSNVDNAKDFAMMVTANTVLADTRNKAPVFEDQDEEMEGEQTDQERSVGENVPAIGSELATTPVRNVGAAVVAMDFITDNAGGTTPETLTYTLGGPDAASFTIGRGDAQISTKADVALDKETKETYTVTVTATDPSGETATITVTITVTNVDEAPEITVGGLAISGTTRVDYAEDRRDAVATYRASGPDAAMATWSLDGDDAGDFRISSAGVLTFRTSPDFEDSADDNVYMVTVKADDGTYMDTHDVTITVTGMDESVVQPGQTLEERYDTDNNGLDKDEVIAAINDYLFGEGDVAITKDQAIEIINLYLFGN